jgi:hypothetical protein
MIILNLYSTYPDRVASLKLCVVRKSYVGKQELIRSWLFVEEAMPMPLDVIIDARKLMPANGKVTNCFSVYNKCKWKKGSLISE